MCGIFGIITRKESKYSFKLVINTLEKLALLSESRGKDSSGICFRNDEEKKYSVIKATKPISGLLKDSIYKKLLKESLKSYKNGNSSKFISFGHSRLVTNGSQLSETNNQPVIKNGIIAIHNGIIVNVDDLWEKYPEIIREYEIDTEVMLSLVKYYLDKGESIVTAIERTFDEICGIVATAMFFDDRDEALLATNNGSLYYATNNVDFLVFASEGFMLNKLLSDSNIESITGKLVVKQLEANTGLFINLNKLSFNHYKIGSGLVLENLEDHDIKKYGIENTSIKGKNSDRSIIVDADKFHLDVEYSKKRNLLEYNIDKISKLKRCSKCLLPQTFPFIQFDEKGVCNYCNNYVPRNQPKPIEELFKIIEPYRSKNNKPDCLIPFSGGRDSTFILHYVTKILNLKPITYTYDWGMVTDLARRNIARVCGKLGVENIIVAANIKKKRENIRKNISAWLKKPDLGMIPLFMAGDKQFFKYANQVKKQNGLKLQIWGFNFLENTDFKVGFCGVHPDWNKEMIYSMNLKRQIKLYKHIISNIVVNPSYINFSVFDTIESFLSRYTNPRKDYYHFFDYYQWNEKEIEDILINEYDWEVAKDLSSTWRIGDGTASFYNYIYNTIAGFTEFDTFRSNQIREGMILREDSLASIYLENQPRYESLRWYLEIVGLDYERTIKRINDIPKLY